MTRQTITREILGSFMLSIGKLLKKRSVIYLTGGSTALLMGFRDGTIDIDLAGEIDELFNHISKLKEKFRINIELAKPTDFVPSLPGEEERHILVGHFGNVTFMHFDPYSQVFSKIVRSHATDLLDVAAFVRSKCVDLKILKEMVKKIPDRHFAKYPRLNRVAVEKAIESFAKQNI